MTTHSRIETVFAATDFSATSERVVSWAAELARSNEARLVLYHGIAAPMPPLISPSPTLPTENAHELERRSAIERLEETARALRPTNVSVEVDVQIDLGASTILQRAHAFEADLVVAGTRGRTRLAKALLGSIATRLIRDAKVPVLIVPPCADAGHEISRVLIPTDLAGDVPGTIAVIEPMLGGGMQQIDVTLLHVHEASYEPSSPWSAPLVLGPRSPAAKQATVRLGEIANRLGDRVRTLHTVSCGGDPARAIDREAQHIGADLIVMAHGHSRLPIVLRASTVERVLAGAPCPVLAVRKPRQVPARVGPLTARGEAARPMAHAESSA